MSIYATQMCKSWYSKCAVPVHNPNAKARTNKAKCIETMRRNCFKTYACSQIFSKVNKSHRTDTRVALANNKPDKTHLRGARPDDRSKWKPRLPNWISPLDCVGRAQRKLNKQNGLLSRQKSGLRSSPPFVFSICQAPVEWESVNATAQMQRQSPVITRRRGN
jgi:hypothetical protein